MKKSHFSFIGYLILFGLLVGGITLSPHIFKAALRPYCYFGKIKEIQLYPNKIVTLQTEYECGNRQESVKKILKGKVPNSDALDGLQIGDHVEVISLGRPEEFITIARMGSEKMQVITDVYGDPGWLALDLPNLLGNLDISYHNQPDCAKCGGSVCQAKYTTVSVAFGSDRSKSCQLHPHESCELEVNNQTVKIIFYSGQVPAGKCGDQAPGPQPVSNFTIHIQEAVDENNPPNTPSDPVPPDASRNQPIAISLKWRGGDPDTEDKISYKVYLDTTSPPTRSVASDLAQPTYRISKLNYDTTYYWQVVSKDTHGASTKGPIWSFTTRGQTEEKMYWANLANGAIQRANLDGSEIETLVTGLESPYSIALDATHGEIYWADAKAERIQRANLDGTRVETLVTSGLDWPRGIALDPTQGKIYWGDLAPARIRRANLDGSQIEDILISGRRIEFGKVLDLALDTTQGKIYWTDAGANKIQRSNLDGTGVESLVTNGVKTPYSIALYLTQGKMYWTDPRAGKIQRANLDGSNVEDLVTDLDSRSLFGIALDATHGKFYWVEDWTNKIRRANLDGTEVETLITEDIWGPIKPSLRDIELDVGV